MSRKHEIKTQTDIPIRRKRKFLNFQTKLDIIKRSALGEKSTHIGQSLGLSLSTVATIIKGRERILKHVAGAGPMTATIITKRRSGIIAEMEKQLVLWVQKQKEDKVLLKHKIVQEKALSIYEELKKSCGNPSGETFFASRGWLNRFRIRANLHNISLFGEAVSSADAVRQKFSMPIGDVNLNINRNNEEPSQETLYESMQSYWEQPDQLENSSSENDETIKVISIDTIKTEPTTIVNDLVKLKSENKNEQYDQEAINDQTPQKQFTTEQLEKVFNMLDEALDLLEQQDTDSDRFNTVSKAVSTALSCYKKIYLRKKGVFFKHL